MHESTRNERMKLQKALLLASSDLEQAAAARALERESDGMLARALETAMIVCYFRPYSTSSLKTLPDQYVPTTSPDSERHAILKELRDQVHAHTDKASGRTVSVQMSVDGDIVNLEWREGWLPFPRQVIPAMLEYFEERRDQFRIDAAHIQVELDSAGS